jgi:taurine dioxygenase
MFVIETRKISDSVGADVLNIDIRAPLTAEMREALMQAWAQFLVLRFRGQPLGDPELIAFSKNLGELEPPGPNPQGKPYLPEFPELNVISNIKQGGQALGGLGDGEAIWHSDMTYASSVPMGAVLHAIEITCIRLTTRCPWRSRTQFVAARVSMTQPTTVPASCASACSR